MRKLTVFALVLIVVSCFTVSALTRTDAWKAFESIKEESLKNPSSGATYCENDDQIAATDNISRVFQKWNELNIIMYCVASNIKLDKYGDYESYTCDFYYFLDIDGCEDPLISITGCKITNDDDDLHNGEVNATLVYDVGKYITYEAHLGKKVKGLVSFYDNGEKVSSFKFKTKAKYFNMFDIYIENYGKYPTFESHLVDGKYTAVTSLK